MYCNLYEAWHNKGQLISKGLFLSFQFFQEMNEEFLFIFLEELKIPKRHFDFNWPLVVSKQWQPLSLKKILFWSQILDEDVSFHTLPLPRLINWKEVRIVWGWKVVFKIYFHQNITSSLGNRKPDFTVF